MGDVTPTRQRVIDLLTAHAPVQVDAAGRISFAEGSTRVYIEVAPHPDTDATLVFVTAPVLFGVTLDAALYEYVALNTDNWFFGHLGLWRDEPAADGTPATTATLVLRHVLLGDDVSGPALLYAVYGVAGTADSLDEELAARFGGERYSES